jgi:tetratricopeptide (TPR) repeat protein
MMRRVGESSISLAGLSLACLGMALAACGGRKAQPAPVQVAPKVEAPPPPPPAEDSPASTRFLNLTKEIEKLGSGEPVDRAWLEGELNAILKTDPEFSAARFDLGVLKELDGDKAAAQKMYEQILQREPDFVPAKENLAADLVGRLELDKAVEVYRRDIEKDPKNVTSRLALARILLTRKAFEEAITLCRQALQRQADAIEAFRILATSYDALGNAPMAELIIGRVLKVNKEDLELHYLLAEILLKRKEDFVAGVNKLKQVVTMDPKWLKVRAQLADIALTYRDFGNAAQQLEVVTKEQPKNRAAMNNLAVAYKGMGRYEQAEALYQKVLQTDPNDADVLWNLAVLYHRYLNRYDDAIAMYKRAKAAAKAGDEKFAECDKLATEAETQKNNIAEQQARAERERKKIEAINAAVQAVRDGKKPEPETIGNEQERTETAWQLASSAQGGLQGVDPASEDFGNRLKESEIMLRCALAIIPDTPSARSEVCAPMQVWWAAQVMYPLGRLEDALAAATEARKCDPNNPDAQLIEQQLTQLIAQQKAQKAAESGVPAEGTPATDAAAPAPEPQKPAKPGKRGRR